MDYRKPPKSAHYQFRIPGQCRHCGLEILDKKGKRSSRALWHPACIAEYKILHFPQDTRKAVYKRDKGICAKCGHKCARKYNDVWHLDHVKPLVEAKGKLEYWQLPNLQTLCIPCHTAKTSAEATARALARKIAKDKLK